MPDESKKFSLYNTNQLSPVKDMRWTAGDKYIYYDIFNKPTIRGEEFNDNYIKLNQPYGQTRNILTPGRHNLINDFKIQDGEVFNDNYIKLDNPQIVRVPLQDRIPLQDRVTVRPVKITPNNKVRAKRKFTIFGSTDPNSPDYLPYTPKSERRNMRNTKAENAPVDEKYKDKNAIREKRMYNRNVLLNSIASNLRRYPLLDSVQQYIEKLRDTPDYSGIENAKNYALKPTQVQRQSPSHISGNLKFNQYDYTGQANAIGSQIANGINTISRQSRGNTNALIGHIGNLLASKINAVGNAYMGGFETNEKNRLNVAKENMEAEKYNATVDNGAEQAYVSDLNTTARQDKTNAINALDRYAQQKYMMDTNYENQLRGLRDQMVTNVGETGREAYETNRANTNKEFNYWYDLMGRMHFIPQEGGARYVETPPVQKYALDYNDYLNVYNSQTKENQEKLKNYIQTYGEDQGRWRWYNEFKYKNN